MSDQSNRRNHFVMGMMRLQDAFSKTGTRMLCHTFPQAYLLTVTETVALWEQDEDPEKVDDKLLIVAKNGDMAALNEIAKVLFPEEGEEAGGA
jgi:hypothetical protein